MSDVFRLSRKNAAILPQTHGDGFVKEKDYAGLAFSNSGAIHIHTSIDFESPARVRNHDRAEIEP